MGISAHVQLSHALHGMSRLAVKHASSRRKAADTIAYAGGWQLV
jgi:hypothetical protein